MDVRASPRRALHADHAAEELHALRRLAVIITVPLSVAYLAYAFARSPGGVSLRAVAPFVVAAGASVASSSSAMPGPAGRLLRVAWPVLLWPPLYDAAVQVVMLSPERYVDRWFTGADALVLDLVPGVTPWALGGPVEELANLFYVSYYVVVPAGLLWSWGRHGEEAGVRYGLGVLLAFAICAALWLLVPAGGYHPNGCPTTPGWGPFTRVARWIYWRNPHYAGAFPSSHVALAFASAAVLTRLGANRSLWAWALGVAWSTWQGRYHYLVDAPPGILAGCVAGWLATRAR